MVSMHSINFLKMLAVCACGDVLLHLKHLQGGERWLTFTALFLRASDIHVHSNGSGLDRSANEPLLIAALLQALEHDLVYHHDGHDALPQEHPGHGKLL